MPQPSLRISLCEGYQGSCDDPVEGLARARLGLAQRRLHLGPTRLDGRQVRRVRRHVQRARSTLGDGLLNPHGCVCPQMAPHNDVARRQGRRQHPLHGGTKDIRVGRTVDGHDRLQAWDARRSQHGDMRAIGLGHAPSNPRACGSTAIAARHRQVHARFVHACQGSEVECRAPLLVDRPRPRCCRTRHIVGTLTWTRWQQRRLCTTPPGVASGLSPTNRCTTAWPALSRRGF
jgi:hypothetical protein